MDIAFIAIQHDQWRYLELYLQRYPEKRLLRDEDGCTLLHHVVKLSDKLILVDMLIDHLNDDNHGKGTSPLMMAISPNTVSP